MVKNHLIIAVNSMKTFENDLFYLPEHCSKVGECSPLIVGSYVVDTAVLLSTRGTADSDIWSLQRQSIPSRFQVNGEGWRMEVVRGAHHLNMPEIFFN